MTWVSRLSTATIIVGLVGIGLWQLRRRLQGLAKDLTFTEEFGHQLKRYVESNSRDHEAYAWLTHRATRMQLQMGSTGMLAKYKPPFANYFISNVAIVANFLPLLHQYFADDILARTAYQYAQAIQDALLRHHGILSDRREHLISQSRNPLRYFREGVRAVLEVPLEILGSLGAVPARWIRTIGGSSLFDLLVGVASLVTIVSGILAMVVGWHEFWGIVKRLLH